LNALNIEQPVTDFSAEGNTFVGGLGSTPRGMLDGSNQLYSSAPPVVAVFLRPNLYEPLKARLAVFNWTGAAEVRVDLSGFLKANDMYVIRNVQDYFGEPVASGKVQGLRVTIPMNLSAASLPVSPPPSIPPQTLEFGAFEVLRIPGAERHPVSVPMKP
jgi:hypothetical protein